MEWEEATWRVKMSELFRLLHESLRTCLMQGFNDGNVSKPNIPMVEYIFW